MPRIPDTELERLKEEVKRQHAHVIAKETAK